MLMSSLRISDKRQAVVLPYDARLDTLIPHHKKFDFRGNPFSIVPHNTDESKMLRTMGYDCPAPILHQYNWRGITPFDHQKMTAALITMYKRAYVLNDPGTGKSLSALFAIDWLMQRGEVKKVLIVAPLSILHAAWKREVFTWMPHMNAEVIYGSADKRKKLLQGDQDIDVINFDGVGVVMNELMAKDYDLILIDESTAYKNARTKRWKMMAKLVKKAPWAWAMTGSPTPQSPLDSHGQIKMITPGNLPTYHKQFKEKLMRQISTFMWVARPEANELVHEMMQPAVRFASADCLDLPDMMFSEREVPLSALQQKAYTQMKNHMAMMIAADEVSAVNAGVLLGKLMQVCSGFVYSNDQKAIDLAPLARLKETEAVINESEGKVIVFASHKAAVDLVHEHLLLAGHKAAKVYGDTSKAERDKIFQGFQHGDQYDVLVAHPATTSHGLTLTEASVILWYSLPMSYETFLQANHRIHRPGQTRKHYIVTLLGAPVESRVLKKLQSREKCQDALLEMFNENTGGI